MKIELFRLKNGLRCLLFPKEDFESTTFSFYVKLGTDYENKKELGISHFLEHMVFRGSKNFPSVERVREELEKMAAIYNGETYQTQTHYYIKTLSKFQERSIFLLSDLVKNPLFKDEDIEKEKSIILEEIKMSNDDRMKKNFHNLMRTLFKNKIWGEDVAGREETIKNINRKILLRYHQKFYNAQNSLFIAVGKIENLKRTKKLIEENFKDLPQGKNFFLPFINISPPKKTHFEIDKEINQVYFSMGTFMPVYGFKDLVKNKFFIDFFTANRILGAGSKNRLFSKIRDELGLVYYIESYLFYNYNRLMFFIASGIKKEKFLEGIQAIFEEIEKIKKDGFSKEEIEIAYNSEISEMLMYFENPVNLSRFYANFYLYFLKEFKKIDLKDFLIKLIPPKPNFEEINKKAKFLLNKNFCFSLTIENEKSKKDFYKLLKNFNYLR
jgi:predicted Zn-dependent peptidase